MPLRRCDEAIVPSLWMMYGTSKFLDAVAHLTSAGALI